MAHTGQGQKERYILEPRNLRQVHLIHAELHEELRASGFGVFPSEMGENSTTRGMDLLGLPTGARLHLGAGAVVEVRGLRNPCTQLDRFLPGLMPAALSHDEHGKLFRKAGIMGVVLKNGIVEPGGMIHTELPSGSQVSLDRFFKKTHQSPQPTGASARGRSQTLAKNTRAIMKHALLLFCLIAIAHADPVRFHPESWTLGVQFPNPPTRYDKTLSTKRGDQVWTRAECKAETEVVAVERTLQPDAVRAEQLDLAYDHGKASLLSFLSGSLKSEEKIIITGREGRRWIIEDQKKSRILEFRVVSVGQEFYVFTYERPMGDATSSTSDAFFSTIR